MKAPKVYTPVSDLERRALMALDRVKFPRGTGSKRFAREMQGAPKMTDGQRRFMWTICWHFRRQIGDEEVKAEGARWRKLPALGRTCSDAREAGQGRTPSRLPSALGPSPEPVPEAPRYEPTSDDIASVPSLFDGLEGR